MRWFVALGLAALMFAAGIRWCEASDWGHVLGGPQWASIPEGKGMNAFAGKWQPWDRNTFSVVDGEFYIWPNGRMGAARHHQIEYRVVNQTSFYIIVLTKTTYPDETTYHIEYFLPGTVENGQIVKMRSGTCKNTFPDVVGDQKVGPQTWALSRRDLKKFWEKMSPCNPFRFPPSDYKYAAFWGDHWDGDEAYSYLGPLDFPPPPLKPAAK